MIIIILLDTNHLGVYRGQDNNLNSHTTEVQMFKNKDYAAGKEEEGGAEMRRSK